ncbi:ATP-binding protein [Azospirillum doebereinerae]|uniref:ATP-binding protein n=1 Tax=Azospirillum doebereinerae TaxID=92933 RepID=UPI001EE5363C|nr:ATP-binding protein [Azospirillum doebereinerae]MCG5240953.1 putative DNA binding domain-containing protein [Azospirillum doebereinerae]
MVSVSNITAEQAQVILDLEENHFGDLKAIEIKPAKLTEFVSAFANAAGGDIYIGVDEREEDGRKFRSWRGFGDVEAANAHLHTVEAMKPLGGHYIAEFLRCEGMPGSVLRLEVLKTKDIIKASDGHVYIRKGAQKYRVETSEGLERLKLDKGIISFEDESVNTALENVTNSNTIIGFMLGVIPTGEPESWLKKQDLLTDGKPTVAATLLFHDEPQSALPKRSAIKIYRYKTKEEEGQRETLAFDPITIEGCAYDLIYQAVEDTKKIIEGIKKMTDKGLEPVNYPHETLHEIITNAVLHRDYSIASDIHIRIYDNRVEIQSPGKLPGHVTTANILQEQAARNGRMVRLINKFPNPPNKDVGEGLNTAFNAMTALKLKEPVIEERESSVVVNIRHQALASPQEAVIDYLKNHDEITNSIGRDLTGIRSENTMKEVFYSLKKAGLIEPVPDKRGNKAAWRKSAEKAEIAENAADPMPNANMNATEAGVFCRSKDHVSPKVAAVKANSSGCNTPSR